MAILNLKDGHPNGQGKHYFKNGEYFEGLLENGKLLGTRYTANGTIIQKGLFRFGQFIIN